MKSTSLIRPKYRWSRLDPFECHRIGMARICCNNVVNLDLDFCHVSFSVQMLKAVQRDAACIVRRILELSFGPRLSIAFPVSKYKIHI